MGDVSGAAGVCVYVCLSGGVLVCVSYVARLCRDFYTMKWQLCKAGWAGLGRWTDWWVLVVSLVQPVLSTLYSYITPLNLYSQSVAKLISHFVVVVLSKWLWMEDACVNLNPACLLLLFFT